MIRLSFLKEDLSKGRIVIVFLSSFAMSLYLLQEIVLFAAKFSTDSEPLLEQVLNDNDIGLSALAMALAVYAVCLTEKLSFYQTLLPWKKLNIIETLSYTLQSVCSGFLTATIGIAFSIFFGFLALNAPRLEVQSLYNIAPSLLIQVFTFVFWLLIIEASRRLLWRQLLGSQQKPHIFERLLIVGFETFILFKSLSSSPHLSDQVLSILICLSLSLWHLIWMESESGLYTENRQGIGSIVRSGLQFGFLGGLYFVYGQWRAGAKSTAVFDLIEGPNNPYGLSLLKQGIVGQLVFILLILFLSNAMLYRIAKKKVPLPWLKPLTFDAKPLVKNQFPG